MSIEEKKTAAAEEEVRVVEEAEEVVTVLVRQRNATVVKTADDIIIKAADLDAVRFRDETHKQRTVDSYRNEVGFYRTIREDADVRTAQLVPDCHGTIEPDSNTFVVLLENVGSDEEGADDGLDFDRAAAAMDWLAAFHTSFLKSDRGGAFGELWEHGGYYSLEKRRDDVEKIEGNWRRLHSHFRKEGMGVSGETFGQRLVDHAEQISVRASARPRDDHRATLIHGDFKAANLRFGVGDGGDGFACRAIDFQWTGWGLGASDVAYLLCTSLSLPLLNQESVRLLVERYYQRLGPSLRERYSFESFLVDLDWCILDYVRFTTGAMWGAVTPSSMAENARGANRRNIGLHKRSLAHLNFVVSLAENARHLID